MIKARNIYVHGNIIQMAESAYGERQAERKCLPQRNLRKAQHI